MSNHFRSDSTLMALVISVLLVGAVTYAVTQWTGSGPLATSSSRPASEAKAAALTPDPKSAMPAMSSQAFVASAPGRVEPWGGEIKVGAQAPGRIVEVAVEAGEHVQAGDLLFRVDDDELIARLAGADTEVAIRLRERDEEPVRGPALERRQALDMIALADHSLFDARMRLDTVMSSGTRSEAKTAASLAARSVDLAQAHADYKAAELSLNGGHQALAKANTIAGLPQPTRLEASLASSRADSQVLRVGLGKMRVRAPIDGTVLRVTARLGETAAPMVDSAQVILGDLTKFRVTAEVDERDAGKIKPGQMASLVAKSLPDRKLEARVVTVGEALTSSKFGSRIPGRQSDFDVLEVLLEVASDPALKPGMRVDVFFKQATDLKGKTAQSN